VLRLREVHPIQAVQPEGVHHQVLVVKMDQVVIQEDVEVHREDPQVVKRVRVVNLREGQQVVPHPDRVVIWVLVEDLQVGQQVVLHSEDLRAVWDQQLVVQQGAHH
jgi:hypothetical protein